MPELVLIACVVALLFGGSKLPELGKGVGTFIKELKNAGKDDE